MPATPPITGTATFSPCKVYRYRLSRDWGAGPRIFWLMLNPSTADESANDPTIRRCIAYSQAWGYGGLYVGNIFALRSTDPKALYAADDPIGPGNDEAITDMAAGSTRIVAAWGNHGRLRGRGAAVKRLLRGCRLECLAYTRDGQPVHPLYQKRDRKPQLFI